MLPTVLQQMQSPKLSVQMPSVREQRPHHRAATCEQMPEQMPPMLLMPLP